MGDVGTVCGPCQNSSLDDSELRVRVQFPDMKADWSVLATDLHTEGQELAGGYKIGDRVVSLMSRKAPEYGSIAMGDVGTEVPANDEQEGSTSVLNGVE